MCFRLEEVIEKALIKPGQSVFFCMVSDHPLSYTHWRNSCNYIFVNYMLSLKPFVLLTAASNL